MPSLTFARRTMSYRPRWLGNRDAPDPFMVDIKRLTEGELREFGARFDALIEQGTATVDELYDLFAPVLTGPRGKLTIDGEDVPEGDLRALLTFAAMEPIYVGDPLAVELGWQVGYLNTLAEEVAGKSERRSGTGTSGPPADSTDSPPPEAAPAAESSS